jgi:cellobiose-specific phosphotransferase system component IIA
MQSAEIITTSSVSISCSTFLHEEGNFKSISNKRISIGNNQYLMTYVKENIMEYTIYSNRKLLTVSAIMAVMALGGCANLNKKPRNVLTKAETVVTQADRAGTRAYAAYDLNKAHLKLKMAKQEMNAGHYRKARYLADEAKVDAELAIAKTQTDKTKAAEGQINKSTQSLHKSVGTTDNMPQ